MTVPRNITDLEAMNGESALFRDARQFVKMVDLHDQQTDRPSRVSTSGHGGRQLGEQRFRLVDCVRCKRIAADLGTAHVRQRAAREVL